MKNTLRITSLVLAAAMCCVALAGCRDSQYEKYDRTGEKYDYYLPDYVDVCDYSGIEVPDITYTPSVEDVQNYVTRTLAAYGDRTNDVGRPCEDGDVVDILTTATLDGEEYPALTFTKNSNGFGHSLVLGTYEFDIPEIDDTIIGMSDGETKTITFNLPNPYYIDYINSGKEITIEININYVDGVEYPDDTDDFYSQHFGYSKSEYSAKVQSQLQENYNGYIADYKQTLTWNYILDHSKLIKLPEKETKDLYDSYMSHYRKLASDGEQTLKEYVLEQFGYDNLDDFYGYLTEYTNNLCYENMILYYIARRESIYLLEDYYQEQILEMTKDYQITEAADAESFLDYYYGLDSVRENLRLKYVRQWIADNAVVREDVTTFYSDELNKD